MRKLIYLGVICYVLLFFWVSAHAGTLSPDLENLLQSLGPHEELAVVITFHGKANITLYNDDDKDLRRSKIVKALKTGQDLNEKDVKTFLEGQGISRMVSLWIASGMAAIVPATLITDLASFPQVESIGLDYVIQAPPLVVGFAALPEWNINAIKAPDLWNLGFTGTGVVVANMDTGVDIFHPDLSSKWRGGTNSWFNPYSDPANASQCATPNQCSICETNSTTPCDIDGHGTGTMGIMVGGSAGGTAIGVAPDAKWIAVKVLNDAGIGLSSIILQSFQWILGLPAGQAPDIVNNSWGEANPNGCDPAFQSAIQALKTAGISVAFAAGNDGPNALTSISPANNVGAFSVGAIDINNTIASFSSRGPSPPVAACGNGSIFPQVVAPGVNVRSASTTNGSLFLNSYAFLNGTSFSAPHAAGAMALLSGAFPTLTPSQLESILEQTALGLGSVVPNNDSGYGLIDCANAYQAAFNTVNGNIPEITVSPLPFAFANTKVNTALLHDFTITNRGAAGLMINSITFTGASPSDFMKQSDPCTGLTIAPLSSCTVGVSFSPGSVGLKIADLSIQSNDPHTPILDVPLSGKGVNPDKIGIYRPSNSTFYLRNSNTSGFADLVINYGNPGDTPVVGDWNGDGMTTVGAYRSSNSTFYLRNSNTSGFADTVINYGVPGDIPVVGDWTGNGTTTIGVYRPSNSTFYLRNSNTSGFADLVINYGVIGDTPVAGDWNGLP
jgi:serine protease AprX